LNSRQLLISGVRHDPAAKLGYQQMEILYGRFETDAYLARAIDEDGIEATYQDGFLSVFLPKARPRRVPVVGAESSDTGGQVG
jgi:HSP20 family molecular chaperone IbpA